MKIDGFDWDDGNWPKCAKHGLTKHAIEVALSGEITIFDDPANPAIEERFRAIAEDDAGRMMFIVFCFRRRRGKTLLRPISARYMHDKEIQHYEGQKNT